MKKVLLINAPLRENADKRSFQPLGISYICAFLRVHGIVCDVRDGNNPNQTSDTATISALALKYEIVGISTNTANFDQAVDIANRIKKSRPDVFVFLGGHHPTFLHETIIKSHSDIDGIVRGEGEYAWLEIVRRLSRGDSLHGIPGLTWRSKNGDIFLSNEIPIIENLDELPDPIRDFVADYGVKCIHGNPMLGISVSSSRGCPYGCAFCSVTNFSSHWRGRSPKRVIAEVLDIYRAYGNVFLVFCDDNFFIDQVRSLEIICGIYNELGPRFVFSFATRADQILAAGFQCLQELKEKGCYSIELGIENGCIGPLERMNKRTTPGENAAALEMVRNAGIFTAVDYIMFDPDTTLQELKGNYNFLRENGLVGHFPLLLDNRIKPYPGTAYMNMDLDCYFRDKKTELVYSTFRGIEEKYLSRIEQSIEAYESMDRQSDAKRAFAYKYMWNKEILYDVFSYCLQNVQEWDDKETGIRDIENHYRLSTTVEKNSVVMQEEL